MLDVPAVIAVVAEGSKSGGGTLHVDSRREHGCLGASSERRTSQGTNNAAGSSLLFASQEDNSSAL